MMGDGGLGDFAETIDKVVDAEPIAAEVLHNFLSCFVGHCFGEGDGGHC